MGIHYALDSAHEAAPEHLGGLAGLLDPITCQRILSLSGGDLTGWRCWEAGAGGGDVAVWLAEQVGRTGQVVATDVNTAHIPAHPWLLTLEHDINSGPPVDFGEGLDLFHARLLFMHLHDRREILRRIAGMLAPGGWLLIEDWATAKDGWVVRAPDAESAQVWEDVQGTLDACFTVRGSNARWARRIHEEMEQAGLADVDTAIAGGVLKPGTPGMRAAAATIQQLWDRLLEAGLPETMLHRAVELTEDPQMLVQAHPLHSTAGRRPQ